MPEGRKDLIPPARPTLRRITDATREACMPLPLQLLLGPVLLPAVGILLHGLHGPAHYALLAGGHLQLPAGNLAGVENRHPSHHEVPSADRLLL